MSTKKDCILLWLFQQRKDELVAKGLSVPADLNALIAQYQAKNLPPLPASQLAVNLFDSAWLN